jgi:hypothetical protein
MRRWLAFAPVFVALAVIAVLVTREHGRRGPVTKTRSPAPAAQPMKPPASAQTVQTGPRITAGKAGDSPDDDETDEVPPEVDLADPASVAAYREYFAAQARNHARYLAPIVFEDAVADLGLTPRQHQALLDLYVEYSARSNAATHSPDKTQPARARELEEIQAERERALTELLGAPGMKALNRYRQTIPARLQVVDLIRELGPTRYRLSETQRQRLLDVLLKPGGYLPDREYSPSESPGAVRQEVQVRVEQNERRLLDAARPILNAEQFGIYVSYLAERRQSEVVDATPYFARDLAAE